MNRVPEGLRTWARAKERAGFRVKTCALKNGHTEIVIDDGEVRARGVCSRTVGAWHNVRNFIAQMERRIREVGRGTRRNAMG